MTQSPLPSLDAIKQQAKRLRAGLDEDDVAHFERACGDVIFSPIAKAWS